MDETSEESLPLRHPAELLASLTALADVEAGDGASFRSRVQSVYTFLYHNIDYAKLLLIVILFGISGANLGILVLYLSTRYEQTFVQVSTYR